MPIVIPCPDCEVGGVYEKEGARATTGSALAHDKSANSGSTATRLKRGFTDDSNGLMCGSYTVGDHRFASPKFRGRPAPQPLTCPVAEQVTSVTVLGAAGSAEPAPPSLWLPWMAPIRTARASGASWDTCRSTPIARLPEGFEGTCQQPQTGPAWLQPTACARHHAGPPQPPRARARSVPSCRRSPESAPIW